MRRKKMIGFLIIAVVACINRATIVRGPFLDTTTETPSTKLTTFSENSEISLEYHLDLAFVVDATASMTSYINSAKQNIQGIVKQIVRDSKSQVRLALIEYRDHPPEETSFVTRTHDFTESVSTMKSWLDNAEAIGGGDAPEAVADALYEATRLSWNVAATKVCILISDAPSHALDPSSENSFHMGCPELHDPIMIARQLGKIGVTLYGVGCEPSITPYKDFFQTLAFITGGQYLPMKDPGLLINVITGGVEEELSLRRFSEEVKKAIERFISAGDKVNEDQIAVVVYQKLFAEGAKSKHLTMNGEALEGPSDFAKVLSEASSMKDVKEMFVEKYQLETNSNRRRNGSRRLSSRRRIYKSKRKLKKWRRPDPSKRYLHLSSYSPSLFPEIIGFGRRPVASRKDYDISNKNDMFSTWEWDISLDQIKRLVKKESAKFETS